MRVELISARNKGDNGDSEAAISLVALANQKVSFDHVAKSHQSRSTYKQNNRNYMSHLLKMSSRINIDYFYIRFTIAVETML